MFIDDLLKLRSLRMTVSSGGGGPVDDEDLVEEVVLQVDPTLGGGSWILVDQRKVRDFELGDATVGWSFALLSDSRSDPEGENQEEKSDHTVSIA